MLKKIIVSRQIHPADFLKFLTEKQKKELLTRASFLKGKRVVHINATGVGGGVAELLKSLIPYFRSLGIQSDWYSINPEIDKKFFDITNKIHNALQGAPVKISNKDWVEYQRVNKLLAAEIEKIDCDIIVINDPQPLFAGTYLGFEKKKIFFCHIDTSAAFKPVWEKILPAIGVYDRIVFSNSEFVNGDLPHSKLKIFTPAIDPLSPKQKIVSKKEARRYLKKQGGIPADYPLVAQISRFDIWKNPLGVIQAFRLVQSTHPEARLVLVGFNKAKDNPAAAVIYKDIEAVAKKSEDIYIFFDPKGKNVEEFTIMAQNGADVIVQNSIKEGFGLTVVEAMWKGQPVIGGPASGIRKQITDGENGFIAETPADLAERINLFLADPAKKKKMGETAKKTVIKKFLFPRLVLDHLKIYQSCFKSK